MTTACLQPRRPRHSSRQVFRNNRRRQCADDGRGRVTVDAREGSKAMAGVKTTMMKAVMSGLYHSGAHRLIAPYTQGAGMIFTLHSVKPYRERVFVPNRTREVSPNFLNAVLDQAADSGLDVVSMDEAVRRLRDDDDRRFVSFTFDDGYRDNRNYAYPLFKARNFPMTIYIPTDYPDGRGELWWLALEEIVNRANQIVLCRNGDLWRLPAETP